MSGHTHMQWSEKADYLVCSLCQERKQTGVILESSHPHWPLPVGPDESCKLKAPHRLHRGKNKCVHMCLAIFVGLFNTPLIELNQRGYT